jgi:hypothetical protein
LIGLSHIQGGDGFSIPGFLSGIFSVSVRFLEALVMTVIGGFYLAAQPELYRNGLGKLFLRPPRAEADETIEDIGRGLRLWLIGELIQMVLIRLPHHGRGLANRVGVAACLGCHRRAGGVCALSRPDRCSDPCGSCGDHPRRQFHILDGDRLSLNPSTGGKSDCPYDPAPAHLHRPR